MARSVGLTVGAAARSGHHEDMIGRLEKTVLDCPDPRALAAFYAAVLGMRCWRTNPDWVVIGRAPGMRELAFQRADPWRPPRWPDPEHPQQLHLDIHVDDVEVAEDEVLRLGATPAAGRAGVGLPGLRRPRRPSVLPGLRPSRVLGPALALRPGLSAPDGWVEP